MKRFTTGMRRCWIFVWSTLLAAVSLSSARADAQSADPCSALLAQGIYDAFEFSSANLSESSFHRSLCAADETNTSNTNSSGGGGRAGVNIFGVLSVNLGGDGQRVREFVQAYKRSFCASGDGAAIDASSRNVFQRTASPAVLNAFVSCLQTARSGFNIQHQRINENVITFTLTFANSSTTTASTARFDEWVVTLKEAAKCSSPNLRKGDIIDRDAKTIQCVRAPGRRDEFVVSIHTSGGVYSYVMPALPIPNQSAQPPFGTVLAYAGKTPPPGWEICNGKVLSKRKCPDLFRVVGYGYGTGATEDEFKIPDLQGRFVRGLNGNASGEGRDPEGMGRVLGAFQDWATGHPKHPLKAKSSGEHEHRVHDGYFAEVDCGGGPFHGNKGEHDHDNGICREWISTEKSGAHEHEVEGGDGETRPSNIALNYIIHTGIGCAPP